MAIKETTFRAGFVDTAHFVRSFKAFAGNTPSEYRRKRMDAAGVVDGLFLASPVEGVPAIVES
jgi:AraC-like DNA-binding protein